MSAIARQLRSRRAQATLILLGLTVITLFGTLLRYRGIWFGYPLQVHPDEPLLVDAALRIAHSGNLNPGFFNYPSLNIYLLACLYAITDFGRAFPALMSPINPEIHFHLYGRMVAVLFAAATILVTYKIAARLASRAAGLIAALFLAVSSLHVASSYTLMVDASVAFWLAMSCWSATRLLEENARRRDFVLTGLFAGLAIGSKYTACVAIALLVVACLARWRRGWKLTRIDVLLAFGIVPLAFLVTTPYVLLDFEAFRHAIAWEGAHYRRGHPGVEAAATTSFTVYATSLWRGYGTLPVLLALGGLVWMWIRRPWNAALLSSVPLCLFLLVGAHKVVVLRNLTGVIPFLSVLSGTCVVLVYRYCARQFAQRKAHWQPWAAPLLAVALVIAATVPQALASYREVTRVTLPDTRWIALEWVRDHLPAGARIAREHYTPPIEKFSTAFEVTPLGVYGLLRHQDAIQDFDFVITSSSDYQRFFADPQHYGPVVAFYRSFFASNELIYELESDGRTRSGPTIRIYRILSGTRP